VQLTAVAGLLPNSTFVTPARFCPSIVTVVPPAAGPDVGSIAETAGAGVYV